MVIWFVMLGLDLIFPLLMLFLGSMFYKRPPDENLPIGYRSDMSLKNDDTWAFAHRYLGKTWMIMGSILLVLTVIIMLFQIGKPESYLAAFGGILCIIQSVFTLIPMIRIEKALKKTFDENGRKK